MSKVMSGAVQMAIARMNARSLNDEYLNDPVKWAKDILGVHLWGKQREIVESVRDNKRTVVWSSNGTGKDVPLDTPLPTPNGWTTMGAVQVGDYLLDEQGKPTRVIWKSDVLHNDLYRVTFSDGATQVTSGTHEWDTIDRSAWTRHRNQGHTITDYRELWDLAETRTTLEIRDTLERWGGRNHYIPLNQPLELPEQDLPIDPYILGVWLGDGSSNGPMITIGTDKEFIVSEFAQRGVALTPIPSDSRMHSFAHQGYIGRLRDLGVLNNKHIPMQYLRASYQQRLDLLRGLMDTDGFSNRSSRGKAITGVGIDLMNAELAQNVCELVRTLGARCSLVSARTYLNGRDVGPRYRMNFNPVFDPFTPGATKSLRRNEAGAQQSRKTIRTVVSVEPVPTVPTSCVQVDSPRNLYLCGEHMIPTHNSMACGVVAAWWIATQYPRDPLQTIVVITAPSFSQIKTNVFHELTMSMSRSKEVYYPDGTKRPEGVYQPLPGKITTSGNVAEWRDGASQLAQGRKPATGEIITTFQGIHRKNVLFIIDEAGGMPADMFVAAERMTTNANAKILAVGNPDRRGSEFYKLFYDEDQKHLWNPIHISSFDTPSFTGEKCPQELLDGMPTPEWVEQNTRAWGGVDDPRVRIAIFGDFPDSDESVFFSESSLNRADETEIDPDLTKPRILGVDLSMFGSDESVAYLNQDNRIRRVDGWGQLSTKQAVKRLHELGVEYDVDFMNIDSGGIGAPIISLLKEEHPPDTRRYRVVEMNASAAPPDRRRWVNARAWWYDRLREDMNMGLVDLDLPRQDSVLRKQMTAVNAFIAEGARAGAIQMESKRDMKARVGYSPDEVDALVYAHMTPEELETKQAATKTTVYESPAETMIAVPDYLRAIEGIFDVGF